VAQRATGATRRRKARFDVAETDRLPPDKYRSEVSEKIYRILDDKAARIATKPMRSATASRLSIPGSAKDNQVIRPEDDARARLIAPRRS
jgi:hypothetical protein